MRIRIQFGQRRLAVQKRLSQKNIGRIRIVGVFHRPRKMVDVGVDQVVLVDLRPGGLQSALQTGVAFDLAPDVEAKHLIGGVKQRIDQHSSPQQAQFGVGDRQRKQEPHDNVGLVQIAQADDGKEQVGEQLGGSDGPENRGQTAENPRPPGIDSDFGKDTGMDHIFLFAVCGISQNTVVVHEPNREDHKEGRQQYHGGIGVENKLDAVVQADLFDAVVGDDSSAGSLGIKQPGGEKQQDTAAGEQYPPDGLPPGKNGVEQQSEIEKSHPGKGEIMAVNGAKGKQRHPDVVHGLLRLQDLVKHQVGQKDKKLAPNIHPNLHVVQNGAFQKGTQRHKRDRGLSAEPFANQRGR